MPANNILIIEDQCWWHLNFETCWSELTTQVTPRSLVFRDSMGMTKDTDRERNM